MIYLISDTHFYHKSIIPDCKRPFSSINEMNEKIINVIKEKSCLFIYHPSKSSLFI